MASWSRGTFSPKNTTSGFMVPPQDERIWNSEVREVPLVELGVAIRQGSGVQVGPKRR